MYPQHAQIDQLEQGTSSIYPVVVKVAIWAATRLISMVVFVSYKTGLVTAEDLRGQNILLCKSTCTVCSLMNQ